VTIDFVSAIGAWVQLLTHRLYDLCGTTPDVQTRYHKCLDTIAVWSDSVCNEALQELYDSVPTIESMYDDAYCLCIPHVHTSITDVKNSHYTIPTCRAFLLRFLTHCIQSPGVRLGYARSPSKSMLMYTALFRDVVTRCILEVTVPQIVVACHISSAGVDEDEDIECSNDSARGEGDSPAHSEDDDGDSTGGDLVTEIENPPHVTVLVGTTPAVTLIPRSTTMLDTFDELDSNPGILGIHGLWA
jgi:hypothetical protein